MCPAGEGIDYSFAVQRDVTEQPEFQEGLGDETRRMNALLHSAGFAESFPDLSARLAWLIDGLENQSREAESARDQSRSMLESSPVAIEFLDDQRRIKRVNPAFEDLLGRSADQLLGHDTRALCRDDSAFERVGHEARPVMASGGVYRTVVTLERADETPITVLLKGRAVNSAGDEALSGCSRTSPSSAPASRRSGHTGRYTPGGGVDRHAFAHGGQKD